MSPRYIQHHLAIFNCQHKYFWGKGSDEKTNKQKNPPKLESSDKICFLLASEERKAAWISATPASFWRINQFTPDGDQQWSLLRKFGNLRKARFSSCHCASELLRGAVSHLLLLLWFLRLFTVNWEQLGGATFPSASPLKRNWKYVLS